MIVGICILQYTVFDQLKQRIIQRQQRKNGGSTEDNSRVALSAFSAFLLGAVSKSIATVLTYPLIRFVNFSLAIRSIFGS
jgi:hypothetical protein